MSWLMKFYRRGGDGGVVVAKGGADGDLQVSQLMPPGAELTALGTGYQVITTTAGAALIVRPSTVPLATLYNGDPEKSYIIERAFAHCLVSSTTQGTAGIWLCVHPTGTDLDIADTIVIHNNTRGKNAGASLCRLALNTAVADDGWYPWGVSQLTPTGVLPGTVCIAEVGGRIIVPPTGSISISVVASYVMTFCVGFHWYEVAKDLV